MALIFCDGFDHYGSRANMLDGVYVIVDNSFGPTTSDVRTGQYALGGSTVPGRVVRTLGGAKTAAGAGVAYKYGYTGTTLSSYLMAFRRSASGEEQVSLWLVYDAPTDMFRLAVYRGFNSALLATSAPVVARSDYEHYEMFVDCDDADGAVEVRFDGITVISEAGIDTQGQSDNQMNFVALGNPARNLAERYDDFFAWDTLGSENNDFLGDRRAYTVFADADTVQSDWTSTEASGYEAIDEAVPDDDGSYVEAAELAGSPPVPAVSEFGLQDLPAEVTSIAGVQVYQRPRKTDAGVCDIRAGLVSGASVANGPTHSLPMSYAYRADMFETDPATGAPWAPSAFNAALLRLERTA